MCIRDSLYHLLQTFLLNYGIIIKVKKKLAKVAFLINIDNIVQTIINFKFAFIVLFNESDHEYGNVYYKLDIIKSIIFTIS